MKALMYHYVRGPRSDLPHFTYLDVDDFARQLAYLKREFGFVERDAFLEWISNPKKKEKPEGVVVTFDDGFLDHYQNAAPILADSNAWGLFYVPTGVLDGSTVLDVHRIHLLIGALGGRRCLSLLEELSESSMFPDRVREEFRSDTYVRQSSSEDATKVFKRMLNYFVDYRVRSALIDDLVNRGISPIEWDHLIRNLYMSSDMLKSLQYDGHIVGSHSVTHRLMSKLSTEEQRFEIVGSVETLEEILETPPISFCYPYGGFHSFTRETERLLAEYGLMFSFNVEQRDIVAEDLLTRPYALPRYDCNQFPHGKATINSG